MERTLAKIVAMYILATPAVHAQSVDVKQTPQPSATVSATAGATAAMTEAEVRKVDKDAAKITLKHGEIKNLEMPAMTMVFQVTDKGMLDKVKAGDKVRFEADKVGGAFTLTRIEPLN